MIGEKELKVTKVFMPGDEQHNWGHFIVITPDGTSIVVRAWLSLNGIQASASELQPNNMVSASEIKQTYDLNDREFERLLCAGAPSPIKQPDGQSDLWVKFEFEAWVAKNSHYAILKEKQK